MLLNKTLLFILTFLLNQSVYAQAVFGGVQTEPAQYSSMEDEDEDTPIPSSSGNFVVGPAGGAVFGPSISPGGMSVNLDQFSVDTKKSEEQSINLQQKIFNEIGSENVAQCNVNSQSMDIMGLDAGSTRLELMNDVVPVLKNPTLIKPVGNTDQSMSVPMFIASETLGASQLIHNELSSERRIASFLKRCESLTKDPNKKGDLQLYSYACLTYQVLNNIQSLFKDSDTVYQKTTELDTVLNQAMAENVNREAQIQKAKKEIKEVNQDLKKATDKLKKAKDKLKKAQESLKSAQKELEAANAIQCEEDCTGKDAAVAAANESVKKAQADVDAATKEVETAVKELITFLKTKMGMETGAVLALLSGTIQGKSGSSNDVNFKINDKEFTLIDTSNAIEQMKGKQDYHGHWGKYQEENPNGSQEDFLNKVNAGKVDLYFSYMATHLENTKTPDKEYYDLLGGKQDVTAHNSSVTIIHGGENEAVLGGALDKFLNMGSNGVDNIETIALAVQDYQKYSSEKEIKMLQSMKTPQARITEMTRKLEQLKNLNRKLRVMLRSSICYLDSILSLYRTTYRAMSYNKSDKKPDIFLEYIYNFKTKPIKQKLTDGYNSEVNIEKIIKEFECMLTGGTEQFCKVANSDLDCEWKNIKFEFAPALMKKCSMENIGKDENDKEINQNSEYSCQCVVGE